MRAGSDDDALVFSPRLNLSSTSAMSMRTLPTMVVGILLLLSTTAAAQRSPPIPGGLGLDTWTRGLGIDAGTQGPPGLFLIYRLIDFSANSTRDRDGNALPIPGLKIGARANAPAIVFTAKPHGGPYLTAAVSLPPAAVSFDSDVPPVALENLGLADLFAGLRVGWRLKRYDVVTAYGFYAPTGRFDPDDAASVGRGYWINQLSLGGAAYFDTTRNQRASVLISYERNQPRRRIESKRGDLLNIQGGAGTAVYRNVTAGFAGYALWQVSDERGADLTPDLVGIHTRAFGLGPEIDVTIPKRRMRVDVRAEWDFGVVAHPQGLLFVLGVQYLAWMPAITTSSSPPAGPSDRPHSRP
jgi:hypothetical protein